LWARIAPTPSPIRSVSYGKLCGSFRKHKSSKEVQAVRHPTAEAGGMELGWFLTVFSMPRPDQTQLLQTVWIQSAWEELR